MTRPPLPPYDLRTAAIRVRLAEDAWNTRDPDQVVLTYTADSAWRNRSAFFRGHAAIRAFLAHKWSEEREYRLIKEVWAATDFRIAVRFVYECCDPEGAWKRAHGNEMWEFDASGLMRRREASINDVFIADSQRLFKWPLGRRPDEHPGLSQLGL